MESLSTTKKEVLSNITNDLNTDQQATTKTLKSGTKSDNLPEVKDSSSEGEESEEEGCDIEFPRDNAQDLMQFLHREINNL